MYNAAAKAIMLSAKEITNAAISPDRRGRMAFDAPSCRATSFTEANVVMTLDGL
jgi:hypothetical protein